MDLLTTWSKVSSVTCLKCFAVGWYIYTIQTNTFQFQRMLQFWCPENICREFKLNQLETTENWNYVRFRPPSYLQEQQLFRIVCLAWCDSLRREVKIYLFQTYQLVKLLKGDHVTFVFAGLHSFCFFGGEYENLVINASKTFW